MRQGVDGNPEVRKVTYKNGVLSKIDLASRFPKRPQKNAKHAEKRHISGFFILLRSFRSISVNCLSLISTGQMDYDCFFETKNDALSMVCQRVSKIRSTSNVYCRYILFLEHNSVLYRIYGFLSTQNRTYSGLSTYQVVGDTFGSETTGILSSGYRHV